MNYADYLYEEKIIDRITDRLDHIQNQVTLLKYILGGIFAGLTLLIILKAIS